MNDQMPLKSRLLAAAMHLAGTISSSIALLLLILFFVGNLSISNIPFGYLFLAIGWIISFIIGLLITGMSLLLIKNSHPFVNQCGRAALNFRASVILYLVIVLGLLLITCGALPPGDLVDFLRKGDLGFFCISTLAFCSFCLPIFASVLAIRGKIYNYPLTIKFISEVEIL
jgi:uncharacterized Tic20 family protein